MPFYEPIIAKRYKKAVRKKRFDVGVDLHSETHLTDHELHKIMADGFGKKTRHLNDAEKYLAAEKILLVQQEKNRDAIHAMLREERKRALTQPRPHPWYARQPKFENGEKLIEKIKEMYLKYNGTIRFDRRAQADYERTTGHKTQIVFEPKPMEITPEQQRAIFALYTPSDYPDVWKDNGEKPAWKDISSLITQVARQLNHGNESYRCEVAATSYLLKKAEELKPAYEATLEEKPVFTMPIAEQAPEFIVEEPVVEQPVMEEPALEVIITEEIELIEAEEIADNIVPLGAMVIHISAAKNKPPQNKKPLMEKLKQFAVNSRKVAAIAGLVVLSAVGAYLLRHNAKPSAPNKDAVAKTNSVTKPVAKYVPKLATLKSVAPASVVKPVLKIPAQPVVKPSETKSFKDVSVVAANKAPLHRHYRHHHHKPKMAPEITIERRELIAVDMSSALTQQIKDITIKLDSAMRADMDQRIASYKLKMLHTENVKDAGLSGDITDYSKPNAAQIQPR